MGEGVVREDADDLDRDGIQVVGARVEPFVSPQKQNETRTVRHVLFCFAEIYTVVGGRLYCI